MYKIIKCNWWSKTYHIKYITCCRVKTFIFIMFVMFPGPVRRLRLVNEAGQPPLDWDAIPQWLLKTTSHCRGISHHNQAFFFFFDLTRVTLTTFDMTHMLYFNSHNCHMLSSLKLSCGQSGSLEVIACKHLSYLVFLHSNCSEGTCDGCSFHFLWESQHACPLCTKNHYREIVSACIQGIQVEKRRRGHTDKNDFISYPPQIHHRPITNSCCVERNILKITSFRKKCRKWGTRWFEWSISRDHFTTETGIVCFTWDTVLCPWYKHTDVLEQT